MDAVDSFPTTQWQMGVAVRYRALSHPLPQLFQGWNVSRHGVCSCNGSEWPVGAMGPCASTGDTSPASAGTGPNPKTAERSKGSRRHCTTRTRHRGTRERTSGEVACTTDSIRRRLYSRSRRGPYQWVCPPGRLLDHQLSRRPKWQSKERPYFFALTIGGLQGHVLRYGGGVSGRHDGA